jgi:hypothetical protein
LPAASASRQSFALVKPLWVKTIPSRSKKLSRSSSSYNNFLRSMPRTIMRCKAPGASIRAFQSPYNNIEFLCIVIFQWMSPKV